MVAVLGCIAWKHNIWLVLVAALVCAFGSWTIIRLFEKATNTAGLQRNGWHFLTAVAAGASIWCTHFIAMLAYEPGVPVSFDPVVTISSLFLAVAGAGVGFIIASDGRARFSSVLGGSIVGLAIAAMHYTGMAAYRVQGLVTWNKPFLLASIALSVSLSGMALYFATRRVSWADKFAAPGILLLAIVCLHFTGMTAFQVTPVLTEGWYTDPAELQTLALAVAGVAMVIVGAGLASYIIDDSARAESLDQLRYMALNDSLTGLPNRTSFDDRLNHELEHAGGAGHKVALIIMDLNRFKEINDVRGHAVGDKVLKVLASRMSDRLQDGEFVARLGGDEFAAVYRMQDQVKFQDFLARLEASMFEPINHENSEIVAGASLGVAMYPDNANDKETLINNADLAMYRAKSDLTQIVCFYDQSMDESVRARRNLANDLRDALENNQLAVHYQVQTSVSTGQIRGYEALLRWRHPIRGQISPGEFIPLAEETGLILKLGEWVLRQACSTAASWEQPYKIAVNLSPVQFSSADLPKIILEVLVSTGLSPDRLELELTESTIFADRERSLATLRQIKALGVNIALDDFGTGYSSLETLRMFPFDKIKLDRSFMSEIESSPQAKAIIRAVLALGRSLEIPVLAEGIETDGQLSLLGTEGCDEAQGYLLGRPVSIEQLVSSGQISMAGVPAQDSLHANLPRNRVSKAVSALR